MAADEEGVERLYVSIRTKESVESLICYACFRF